MQYSVVIPVKNECENIPVLHDRLLAVMNGLAAQYEVIYVNDGSDDSSAGVLAGLGTETRVITFKEGMGQSYALLSGIMAASGEWIITLDGDLQNPPEEICKLIKYKNEYDLITGVRADRKDPFCRKVAASFARVVRQVILRDGTRDTGCSLRVFRKELITAIPWFDHFHRFFVFLALRAGYSVKEIEVEHSRRPHGISKYNNMKRACEGVLDVLGVLWLIKRRAVRMRAR